MAIIPGDHVMADRVNFIFFLKKREVPVVACLNCLSQEACLVLRRFAHGVHVSGSDPRKNNRWLFFGAEVGERVHSIRGKVYTLSIKATILHHIISKREYQKTKNQRQKER